MNEIQKIREVAKYKIAIPNIDRACSSVIENSVAIFLPMTRIDKSNVYKKFIANNQILKIENDLFDKVEIRGRLLGQVHKDVLEALLTMPKTYSKSSAQFKVKTTAYKILKKMQKHTGDKQWLMQKIQEISECRIKIGYRNNSNQDESFSFGFISGIRIIDETKIEVYFSPEYTYFLAHNELLDYSDYVEEIMLLSRELKEIQKDIGLSRGLNVEFIKAVVRYMLVHNGRNSKIRVENLVTKLSLKKIMSEKEIEACISDLKRKEVIELLKRSFGIELLNNETILFNIDDSETKKKYYIQKALDFK